MTIVDEVRAISEQAKQVRAVEAYLTRHGAISRNFCIYEGVPGYGQITRIGARVFDLRERGYQIATETVGHDTIYKLVAKPGDQIAMRI